MDDEDRGKADDEDEAAVLTRKIEELNAKLERKME